MSWFNFFSKKSHTCKCQQDIGVSIQYLDNEKFTPEYKHSFDAGADVRAFRVIESNKDYIPDDNIAFRDNGYDLQPGETKLFGCGFMCQLPRGYAFFVCPRSGLAAKHGITVLNAPGICDAGYRGEYCIILHNASKEPYHIAYGDRIAQIVLVRTRQATFIERGFVDTDGRGEGGFGSTGNK